MNFKYVDIKDFNKLMARKGICFTHTTLRDEDLDVLVDVLPRSEVVLERLTLGGTRHLTLADGKFTDALARNNTLKLLYLNGNNISVEGAKRLADALKVNTKCCTLADALKVNKTLKQLDLRHNHIGDEGAKYIAGALMKNETLETIDLDFNKIGDNGAKNLANCFMVNQSIREVSLGNNNITDDGAQKLIEALKLNYGIKSLYMDGNPISKHVKSEIYKLMKDPRRKVPHAKTKHLRATIVLRDEEIAALKTFLATKDQRIDFMEAAIRSPMEQLRNIIDPVDLTGDENNEPSNKRSRTGGTATSSLAIMHEQNMEHNQKMVQVKQEKNVAEANLNDVQNEKEVVETNLEEAKDDLEVANETAQQQLLAADIWQSRFDELEALVAAGKVDGASIATIRNRPLADGH